jgi:hypothetical protein
LKISWSDHLLVRFANGFPGLLSQLGRWETSLLGDKLDAVEIVKPVYICGLARSGSTLMLQLFSELAGVATHRYRDFPFLAIPCFWNAYLDRFTSVAAPVERPHRDRIVITGDSPEAMEEPLWCQGFVDLHSQTRSHRMTGATSNPDFESMHREHLKKILWLRGGDRYVAKNNYHVTRMEYLLKLYPDAHFIVPIRDPVDHVMSLVRQHALFCQYAADNARIAYHLAAAGHFEFGPQRLPIGIDVEDSLATCEAWDAGDSLRGYAIQWKVVYGFVQRLRASQPHLARRIHIVRYEDFCDAPVEQFNWLLQKVQFTIPGNMPPTLAQVSQSPLASAIDGSQRSVIGEIVGEVASTYRYDVV